MINCQIEIPSTGSAAAALTVGSEFVLHCEGEWPELQPGHIELRLEKEDQYKLQLLDFQYASKSRADLKVTSYKPGEHHLKAVQLVDADHSVVLGDLSFTVKSVINPQEPPAEPFGPFGPLSLSLPIWYFLALLLVVVLVSLPLFLRWRRHAQKKKLLAEMRLHEQVQDPLFQFYQVVRKVQRSSGDLPSFVSHLNEAYKIYLARHLDVPTLKWSERKILSEIRRTHREFYDQFQQELRQSLAELSRAQSDVGQLTSKDSQQLLDLLRKQVDQMDRFFKRESKGKAEEGRS